VTGQVPEGRRRAAFGGRGEPQGAVADDEVGTVRRSPDGRWLALLLPSPPHPARWHVQSGHGAGGYERPERVAHWPIVGAVPWSPAAGVPLDGSVPTPASVTALTAPGVRRRVVPRPELEAHRRQPEGPRTVTASWPGTDDIEVKGGLL
jgi:hypothetical protein